MSKCYLQTSIRDQTDKRLLEMIGDNLVSNTIIYVGEGQIKLSIKQGNSNLPVKILDKGVGMLKDYFVKVFEASE